jgi:hypothetical protein
MLAFKSGLQYQSFCDHSRNSGKVNSKFWRICKKCLLVFNTESVTLKHFLQILQNLEFTFAKFLLWSQKLDGVKQPSSSVTCWTMWFSRSETKSENRLHRRPTSWFFLWFSNDSGVTVIRHQFKMLTPWEAFCVPLFCDYVFSSKSVEKEWRWYCMGLIWLIM